MALCPTALSLPSSSSVTLGEETAPVKLPTTHGPRPGLRAQVTTSSTTGWYFKDGSTAASATVSQPPSSPTPTTSTLSVKLSYRFTVSFRLAPATLPLHCDFTFPLSLLYIASFSLRLFYSSYLPL